MWPFKKKEKKLTTLGSVKPVSIELNSKDDPNTRAIKICQVAGLVINKSMYERLGDMTTALEFYQKQDILAGKRAQRKSRK